jgi:HEPN domain-containing protein
MSRAEVDVVRPDLVAAVAFIKQARRQLASAQLAGVDPESSFALSYQAAIKALTGALIAVGRRVTAGEAGHLVLIKEARAQMEASDAAFDRLDRMRRTRHRVFYDIDEVSRLEVDAAQRDAAMLIDMAAHFVHQRSRAASR